MQFVEALLSLVGALSSSSSGCHALAEAGIVPALLPLIKDHNPEHIGPLGLGGATLLCMTTETIAHTIARMHRLAPILKVCMEECGQSLPNWHT